MTYARLMLKRFEVGLNNFADPFLGTLQPCKTKDVLIGLVIFLVVFVVFASLSTEALGNGDAATYLQQMKDLNFTERPVHLGYFLLGAGFIRILPVSDDRAINLMNCLLGALSIMLVYLITFVICHKHIPAITASLLLFTHYMFPENSIYAEVYTPQVCFFLLSILFWLLDKPVLASLSYLVSFLITPSAILALPCFFILRPHLRPLLLFCSIFAISAAVVIFPVRQEYFFGSRGVLEVSGLSSYPTLALTKEGYEIFTGFFLCIPLVAVGLFEIFSRKQLRPFAFALLMLWLVTLFFAEKAQDVPPQLPTYALLCVVGGLGLGMLYRISYGKTRRLQFNVSLAIAVFAVIIAVSMNGFNTFKRALLSKKYRTEYRNTAIRIGKIAAPGYLVIGAWSRGLLFEQYVFQKSFTPVWINIEWLDGTCGEDRKKESYKKLSQAVAERRQIWMLEEYPEYISALQKKGYKVTQFDDALFDTAMGPMLTPIYVANAEK